MNLARFEVADEGCISGFAVGMGMASGSVTVFVEEDEADDIACQSCASNSENQDGFGYCLQSVRGKARRAL